MTIPSPSLREQHAYRNAGADALVIIGQVEDETTAKTYAIALPHAAVTVCRLHASRITLTERTQSRGRRGSRPARATR
ncbi:hypothetical protein ABT173_18500 [Streptomyces sp. NPDC001795]|uniref:hypothetical protein n=1 Tax=unclassified Streptomyces TaxID=2593676 RepID=UPI00332BB2CC